MLKDEEEVKAFLEKFRNDRLEKLAGMTNIRFLSPDEVTQGRSSSERSLRSLNQQNACYGADETVNIVGVADVGKETLFCCPTICRYGDKWYLVAVVSNTSYMLSLSSENMAFCCAEGLLDSFGQ